MRKKEREKGGRGGEKDRKRKRECRGEREEREFLVSLLCNSDSQHLGQVIGMGSLNSS